MLLVTRPSEIHITYDLRALLYELCAHGYAVLITSDLSPDRSQAHISRCYRTLIDFQTEGALQLFSG